MARSLLLSNARIVLFDRIIERGWLLVEAGRIACVSADKPAGITVGVPESDLAGITLFPGFIDVHIHGAVGVDMMEATAGDLLRVSQYLASQGVTGWLPTLVPASAAQYSSAVKVIEDRLSEQDLANAHCPDSGAGAQHGSGDNSARVLGLHYEGPFVNDAQCGALHQEFFRAYSGPADITALPVPRPAGAARLITVAPEISGGIELVRALSEQGWIVALGHTRASVELLDRAFEAGARHLTHFMNAMPPLHHRSPGPVGWGLARADVTCDIVADGVHLDPFVLRLLVKVKSSERLALISDAIAATGLGDGDYQIWGETISVEKGRTRNAHGNIAGSVITMLDAVRMMLSLGVSEVEVAHMAATNPALLLRLDHDCGSIAEAKRADLVGLDQDGKVRLTMVGGVLGSW